MPKNKPEPKKVVETHGSELTQSASEKLITVEKTVTVDGAIIAGKIMSSLEWQTVLGEKESILLISQDMMAQVDLMTFLERLCRELADNYQLDLSTLHRDQLFVPSLRGVVKRVDDMPSSLGKMQSSVKAMISTCGEKLSPLKKELLLLDKKLSLLGDMPLLSIKELSSIDLELVDLYKSAYYQFKANEMVGRIVTMHRVFVKMCDLLQDKYDFDFSEHQYDKIFFNSLSQNLIKAALQKPSSFGVEQDYESEELYIAAKATPLAETIWKTYQDSPLNNATPELTSGILDVVGPEVGEIVIEEQHDIELDPELMMSSESASPEYEFKADEASHYLLNTAQKAIDGHIAFKMSQAIEAVEVEISSVEVNVSALTADKPGTIQLAIRQAIQTAIATKDGQLFIEPIGLELVGIEPDWYANLIFNELQQLEPDERSQLNITVACMPTDKGQQLERHLKDRFTSYKLCQWAMQALDLDATHAPTVLAVGQALSQLLQPATKQRITILIDKLQTARNVLPKNPSVFQKQQYLERKVELQDILKKLLPVNVLTVEDKQATLAEGYQRNIFRAAIDVERTIINDYSWEGFTDSIRQNHFIAPNTQLLTPDIRSALCKLALDNPEQSPALLDVMVSTKGNIKATLNNIVSQGRYPRHIVIHSAAKEFASGGHWTRLKVERDRDSFKLTYVDSLGGCNADFLTDADWLEDLFGPDVRIQKEATGYQNNGWTCGYHALAGIVSELGADGVPNSDLRTNTQVRTQALRNWVFELVTGQSYDDYFSSKAPKNKFSFASKSKITTSEFYQRPIFENIEHFTFNHGSVQGKVQMFSAFLKLESTPSNIKILDEQFEALQKEVLKLKELCEVVKIQSLASMMIGSGSSAHGIKILTEKMATLDVCLYELEQQYQAMKPKPPTPKKVTFKEAEILGEGAKKDVSLPPISLLFKSSSIFNDLNRDFIVKNRHESPQLQRAFDKMYGLIPYTGP